MRSPRADGDARKVGAPDRCGTHNSRTPSGLQTAKATSDREGDLSLPAGAVGGCYRHTRAWPPGDVTPLTRLGPDDVVVEVLAHRADREPLRVARWHPHLSAQRPDRGAFDHRLHDLVFGRVMREPFVVALIEAIVDPFIGPLVGEDVA